VTTIDFRATRGAAPDHPAFIMSSSGRTVTYGELEARSNQLAHLWRSWGLRAGQHIAVLSETNEHLLVIAWAARRAGLVYTLVSPHLTAAEAAYIIRDCGARQLIVSRPRAPISELRRLLPGTCPITGLAGDLSPNQELMSLAANMPSHPIADESEGTDMLYSSGTTGKPKGIRVAPGGMSAGSDAITSMFSELWLLDKSSVYLSTGPMYHSAPLRSCMSVLRLGATAVVMEKWDAEESLKLVQRYRITHSSWVPTMFVRLLRLAPAIRNAYDLSSMQVAMHSAAPCPRWVKEQMLEWWGLVLYEYYGATEGIGVLHITPQEWLEHPGSVGRAVLSDVHIVGEDGKELGLYENGVIYHSSGPTFEYHADPEKTRSVRNNQGWMTVGDIGYLDADGYLYLTDRKAYVVISGGVNIYPQEIEDLLLSHPRVADAAVFGIPNDDLGEEVKAVVEPTDVTLAGPALAEELRQYCRDNLAHYKCPGSFDFEESLPRGDNGKLYKRILQNRYRPEPQAGGHGVAAAPTAERV
jgi:long-chain acyl-CoA synthetase